MGKSELIRKTRSVCPLCIRPLEATIVEEGGRVIMKKDCSLHGKFEIVVARDPAYYKRLMEIYIPNREKGERLQKVYRIYLSLDCNLKCPICFVSARDESVPRLGMDDVRRIVEGRRGYWFLLFGGEPTLHPEIVEIIRLIRKSGSRTMLFTNGLKLVDREFTKSLKRAGLDHIQLQFDGFTSPTFMDLRGRNLLKEKILAIESIRENGIPLTLNVTVVRGVNEGEVMSIINYGLRNTFVRSVTLNGLCNIGRARGHVTDTLLTEDLIEIVEEGTGGRLLKSDLLDFQELFYIVSYMGRIRRRCVNSQSILVKRDARDFVPVTRFPAFRRILEGMRNARVSSNGNRLRMGARLLSSLIREGGRPANLRYLDTGLNLLLSANPFSPFLLLNFDTMCEPLTFDASYTENCDSGEFISPEISWRSMGVGNIAREKNFLEFGRMYKLNN